MLPNACLPTLFLALVVAACGSDGSAPTSLDDEALNVLFIGNSLTYTNDLPGLLEALIAGGGVGPVNVRSVAFPNFGLEDHWTRRDAQNAILGQPWDYVIMQQGPSATEGRPSLLEYSARFSEVIRDGGGEPALYMVWPSTARSFDWDGVLDSYATAAASVGGVFLPAGQAWRVAWESDATLAFYGPDGFHPSAMGTYLAALVMFERLTDRSPVGLPATVTTKSGVTVSVPPSTAGFLQEVAVQTNARYASPAR